MDNAGVSVDEKKIGEVIDKVGSEWQRDKKYTGKVISNDGDKVVVELEIGRVVEHWSGEHRLTAFPVGEEVDVFNSTIYQQHSEGCVNLAIDWVTKR